MYRGLYMLLILNLYSLSTTSGFMSVLRFCNDTSSVSFSTKCVSCSRNAQVDCPPGTQKLTRNRGLSDCTYPIDFKGLELSFGGCRHSCLETVQIPKCCDGYWGPNCDRCPGIHGLVCSGHGECNDTMTGTGSCQCHEDFTGYACEKCANETMYGPTCSGVCDCVNGLCDGGVLGNGECYCESGYEGPRCDQWIEKCSNLSCDENSRCLNIHGYVMCSCNHGYEKRLTNNTCEEINGCLRSPLCHENATCTPNGPLKYNCTCLNGYSGDGYVCTPIDLCQVDNGGCVQNSSLCVYTGPGQRDCQCRPGFEGYIDGLGCDLIDVCVLNSSHCHEHAICRTTGPQQFECVCEDGYGGDGIECYTNIVDRVRELNEGDPVLKNRLTLALQLLEKVYSPELRNHGPFTLFIPTDSGFRTIGNFDDFLNNTDQARQILRQHIVVGALALEYLHTRHVFYTLQGVPAQIIVRKKRIGVQYRYKLHGSATRSLLVKSDIRAANGIIHVTAKMLINSPMMRGHSNTSIWSLIKNEDQYQRLKMLITAAGMEGEFRASKITVVVCSDNAWDTLPSGTLDYFMSEKGNNSLRMVLRHLIFDGVIEIADLINKQRILSKANTHVPVQVTSAGAVMLAEKRIVQADIPAKNGMYHLLNGLLLPSDIYDFLPHRCNDTAFIAIKSPCLSCDDVRGNCRATDVHVGVETCRYFDVSLLRKTAGCTSVCTRPFVKNRCCEGFYGDECQPCPGGFINPCNGNGECTESGTCNCFSGFTGTVCEHCEREDMFGENCTQPCSCLRGQCDNGINGNGACKKGTCARGTRGKNCDKAMAKCPGGNTRVLCHAHAICIKGISQTNRSDEIECTCGFGFEGDGQTCTAINPCEQPSRGGCDSQATCRYVFPGINRCQCDEGWVGSGKYCHRGTECDTHRDCHEHAECRFKQPDMKTVCVCKFHFHGNGTHCVPIDMCTWKMDGCDAKADCTPTGPGTNNCTCWDGYLGDGYGCSPTILKFIEETPDLSKLAELLQDIPKDDNLLLSSIDQYTLFAPSNEAMDILLSRIPSSYWENPDHVFAFLLSHMVAGLKNTQELLETVNGYDKFETLTDGFFIHIHNVNNTLFVSGKRNSKVRSRILESNETANGYVHIIDRAIETFFLADESPDLRTFFAQHPKYSYFGSLLENKQLLDDLLDMNAYTLFVPNNDVINKYYNDKAVTRAYLNFYLLPNIRLTESFDDGERLDTVLGSDHPLSFQVRGDLVLVNEVLISEPDVLTMGGVVHGINGLLTPILHRCDVINTTTEYGECQTCGRGELLCPDGFKKKTKGKLINRCAYAGMFGRNIGCQRICEKTEFTKRCCAHYYGPNCLECPGGPDFPCNHNGDCDEGIDGNGTCSCYPGYTGNACQFCEVNNTVQACGRSCAFNHGGCSQNADCDESVGTTTCVCKPGYIGDGSTCDEPCFIQNGGCHYNATCLFLKTTGDVIIGYVNCTCADGMEGDGRSCFNPPEKAHIKSNSQTGMIVGVTIAVLAVLLLVGVAIVIYLKIKRDSSGFMEVWSKVRRNSDSSCAQLHTNSDDETNVAQPLSPADVNFDNPLYNVSDNF